MGVTVFLVVPNFLAFVVISVFLDGDALNGYVRDGHFFLCAHGSCVEVSHSIWTYSYWHAVTAWGGVFLFILEMVTFVTTGDIVLDFGTKP